MSKIKVGLMNLGCDKNRIDSEIMLGQIGSAFEFTNDFDIADVLIVNTCGFIDTAKEESINTILELAKYKEDKNCKVLIATGCLTQRYGKELQVEMPELDAILGVNDYDKIVETINRVLDTEEKVFLNTYSDTNINEGKRVVSTGHTAYLRISEGCDNKCAYCAIPKIRGRYRSRKMENIIEEAKSLVEQGVKEIIIVAQDTTNYGVDLYGKKNLPELLRKLSEIEGLVWIRLLYAYAEEITDELIQEIKENDKIVKYIDIPIQHISDEVLRNMRRRGRKKQITENIKKLRAEVPNMCLRTTLIVGFPGETEENFEELIDFIKDIKFDRLGAFKYSREEGTAAYDMENQIDEDVKEERLDTVMAVQQRISKEINSEKKGRTYTVVVDAFDGEMYIGRSSEMAPEVDGNVEFTSERELKIGDFVKVEITHALEYDLIGVEKDESSK